MTNPNEEFRDAFVNLGDNLNDAYYAALKASAAAPANNPCLNNLAAKLAELMLEHREVSLQPSVREAMKPHRAA